MSYISTTLQRLSIGEPQTNLNLTMFPLLTNEPAKIDYLLLDQAIERNFLEISEVSDAGSVPNLKVLNKGDKRVLLLDGEELVGAKQNRILNVSVMVPANDSIVVPVSCVESGRWHAQSYSFFSAGRTHYAEGRARKTRAVNQSLSDICSRSGDQREVWGNISRKSTRMDAKSSTSASAELYKRHRERLNSFHDAYSVVPNQVGAIFSLTGSTSGVDLFEAPEALSGSFKKLIESYALDAVDNLDRNFDGTDEFDAKVLLDNISNSEAAAYEAVGEGEEYRFDNESLTGGSLVVDDNVVHLCAFNIVEEDESLASRRGRRFKETRDGRTQTQRG